MGKKVQFGAAPPALPVVMQPTEPRWILPLRGMRVTVRDRYLGLVKHAYDDAKLGPRAFVAFDDGCSGWIAIHDLDAVDVVSQD